MEETEKIKTLYDNLTPYDPTGDDVLVFNRADGMRYITVAVAVDPGMAGGVRQTHSEPQALFPGLNRVSKEYMTRVKADAERQRARGGGVTADMVDNELKIFRDLSKASKADAADMIRASADIELVGELRSDPKHGEAAERAWKAWHSRDATNEIKHLRHFWAMKTGSRKVA